MTTAIVVDDDIDVREVFSEYLRLKGIDVVATGKDGKEAFELYQMHGPDVTIMDLMMPQYDGFCGLRSIKEWNKAAKVVILSAFLDDMTKYKLYHLGADAVLEKPYDIDEILQVISQVQRIRAYIISSIF